MSFHVTLEGPIRIDNLQFDELIAYFFATPFPPVQLLNLAPYKVLFCRRSDLSFSLVEVVLGAYHDGIFHSTVWKDINQRDTLTVAAHLQHILNIRDLPVFTQRANGQSMATLTIAIS